MLRKLKNYQIKKLMLEYIFKFLDKVYFDIWKINYRSQKSIEKLGGKKITLNLDYSIKSKLATIVGYFSIISLNNSAKFKAYIPKIKLTHPEILN